MKPTRRNDGAEGDHVTHVPNISITSFPSKLTSEVRDLELDFFMYFKFLYALIGIYLV